MRMVLLAALPQETLHLRRRLKHWEKVAGTPFKILCHTAPDREVFLVETGMGKGAVHGALSYLSAGPLKSRGSWDLLLSIGFAGGLDSALSAGDVCMVDGFLDHDAPSGIPLRLEVPRSPECFCGIKLPSVTCLTVQKPTDKPSLASAIKSSCALVDMESYHAASFAYDHGMAFLCIRAVSDGRHDELGFDVSAISDSKGRISLAGVARTILRNPLIVKSFFNCRQRSNLAADRLADAITAILTLPLPKLKELACRIQVVPDEG